MWLGIGVGVIAIAGVAAALLLTKGDGDGTPEIDVGADQAIVDESQDLSSTTLAGVAPTQETAPVEVQPPVVVFDQAVGGPIQGGNEYTVGIQGGPANATYRLFVDDQPQADPAPQLPPVVFAPGRHLLVIEITAPEGVTTTAPVLVYAVGGLPVAGFRANLSSVNIELQGWPEAVRQFDEFVALGHTQLQLMPSDWFPSLTPGHWNLFVGDFATSEEALAYCTQFGLAVPDQCFAKFVDPDASAGG